MPRSVLHSLVQSGGHTLNNLRNSLNNPLNLVSHVDDEIRRRVDGLIKQGELALEEGQAMLTKLITPRESTMADPNKEGADFFDRLKLLGIPSRSEIDDLKNQIEMLEGVIADLTAENE